MQERGFRMSNQETHSWPDLAIGLYERLTGQQAEITYEFDNMSVEIPSGTEDSARGATWRLNGMLKIRTRTHDES
jgi:hypothetical protein